MTSFQENQIKFFDLYITHVLDLTVKTQCLHTDVMKEMKENLSVYRQYWLDHAGGENGLLQSWNRSWEASQR